MKIKLSKSQWESIGKKAGWDNKKPDKPIQCPKCKSNSFREYYGRYECTKCHYFINGPLHMA